MYWETWVNSSYNIDGFYVEGDYLCSAAGYQFEVQTDALISSEDYTLGITACKT